jgi:hypothetical protein
MGNEFIISSSLSCASSALASLSNDILIVGLLRLGVFPFLFGADWAFLLRQLFLITLFAEGVCFLSGCSTH